MRVSTKETFDLRRDGTKMDFPFGIRPPNGDLDLKEGFNSFGAFNAYAMSKEGEFADHPQLVQQMVAMLRDDPEAKDTFITEARYNSKMTVNGVTLTQNDVEQIYLMI